jgi:hypothetical protein
VAVHFTGDQQATVAHVEALHASVHHAMQLERHRFRIVFDRRPHCMFGTHEPARRDY